MKRVITNNDLEEFARYMNNAEEFRKACLSGGDNGNYFDGVVTGVRSVLGYLGFKCLVVNGKWLVMSGE